MIKNGIIQDKEINGIPIYIDLIPKSNKTSRPQYEMTPYSITIHETGNKSKGADGKAHTEYVDVTKSYKSWHFTVDDKAIYQELPINENGWHCGDGANGVGNRTSIGIELCINSDGDFKKTKENARVLIQYLIKHGVPNKIRPHKYWSGKDCPHNILKSGWEDFVKFINEDIEKEEIKKKLNEVIEQLIDVVESL